jgi:DNA polymerase (family X)
MGGKAHGGKRISRNEAENIFSKIYSNLADTQIASLTLCGSYRRGKPTCGDLDIVAIVQDKERFDQWCSNHFGMQKSGKKPALNGLIDEAQVEFYIATKENYGSFVQMWTGSAFHNVSLRKKALEMGYSLSQYGLKCKNTGSMLEFKHEQDLYAALNVTYKDPKDR